MAMVFTQLNSISTPVSNTGLPVSALVVPFAGQAERAFGGSMCRDLITRLSLVIEGPEYKDQNQHKRRSRKVG
jgi:hypothetical protein